MSSPATSNSKSEGSSSVALVDDALDDRLKESPAENSDSSSEAFLVETEENGTTDSPANPESKDDGSVFEDAYEEIVNLSKNHEDKNTSWSMKRLSVDTQSLFLKKSDTTACTLDRPVNSSQVNDQSSPHSQLIITLITKSSQHSVFLSVAPWVGLGIGGGCNPFATIWTDESSMPSGRNPKISGLSDDFTTSSAVPNLLWTSPSLRLLGNSLVRW